MARATKDKLTPHDTLNRYRLVNRIAISKACEIWEAEHSRARQTCVIKVLSPPLSGNAAQIKLLKHEFNIASDLKHELIIEMHEYGEAKGLAYIAMEHFPGANLKLWNHERAPESSGLVQQIIVNMATALQYVHEQGIIHRDVKPDNFLVNDVAQVKLIDFALAKKIRGWFGRLIDGGTKAQGTLSYMSPEQIRNQNQDQRSDIYGFGCVVYELISGKPPYAANNPNNLLNKHLRSPIPSLRTTDANVTDSFAAVVQEMLAKQPEDRPASLDEVLTRIRSGRVFQD
jgi:serine/threonine protein kinase